ncbi:MAG: hypothetical protein KatS3mg110_1336 [Pirellulaceae bacterium]|nr:MAG: hypothetical protein KatS3mg110_1336 [Pirellulaceae bacterium]
MLSAKRLEKGRWQSQSHFVVFWLLCVATVASACSRSATPPRAAGEAAKGSTASSAPKAASPSKQPVPQPVDPRESLAPQAAGSQLRRPLPAAAQATQESWFAYYLNEAKVGHAVMRSYSLEGDDGERLLRHEMQQQLSFLRAGQRVEQRLLLQSLETPAGVVRELRSVVRDNSSEIEMIATPQGKTLHVILRTADSSSLQTLPWEEDYRGFFADEQLLREEPPQPGQVRSATMFLPVLHLVGRLTLSIQDWEPVSTLFGREKLLRVESLFRHSQFESQATLWCDAEGSIHVYQMPNLKLTAYRTLKETALAANEAVDLLEIYQVRVSQPIPNPHGCRKAVYRARVTGHGNPERLFVQDASQQVDPLDPQTVLITVRRIRPDDPGELAGSVPSPAAPDLAANSLIQADHPLIRQLAEQVAPADEEPWKWVQACESFVHGYIQRKSLDNTFASALEVAQQRSGDCTEHAVLMAALCRAHGVPARVATGLVAIQDSYAFHMWNEVWVGDRWVPVDATLAQGGIGVGHIKLTVSSLEGVSPFAAMAPVLELISRLELEVVSYE